jgi:hypothetical protein
VKITCLSARVAILFLGFLGAASARALATMPTAALSQPKSPVRVDECLAGMRSSGSGDYRIPNYYVDFAANFTNRSSRDISAVRLRFDIFNSFGEQLQTKYGTDDGQVIAAGQQQTDIQHDTKNESILAKYGNLQTLYVPTWEFINTADTAHSVVCSVDTVMFADGSKWQAPSPKTSALSGALKHASAGAGIFFKYEGD